jgi:hypothetical protein
MEKLWETPDGKVKVRLRKLDGDWSYRVTNRGYFVYDTTNVNKIARDFPDLEEK